MNIITDEEFDSLLSFVKVNYGIDLSTRRTFVEIRMQKLLRIRDFTDFTTYFNFICSDMTGVALSEFISNLTINYTLFLREPYHFEYMKSTVLPYFYEKEQLKKDLRIWSAGCSTGEEPYTLAMMISDYLGAYKPLWDTKILATDISETVLKKAISGSYYVESVEKLPPNWLRSYFRTDPDDPEIIYVSDQIKKEVIFRKHNLVSDMFTFKQKFHVIYCRNVMIYFDEITKKKLIKKFYDNLVDGGYLFIGMSETIDKDEFGFKYIKTSVYRKE
jgi:Methylase of chemotaxis methyl-accepting proteins